MARTKSITQTTGKTTQRARETRRITSLEAKGGKTLSSLEEAVVRMHHGVSLKPEAALASNGVTDELMSNLLEREVDAHVKTGRAEQLPDVPAEDRRQKANPRSARIVDALKNKG